MLSVQTAAIGDRRACKCSEIASRDRDAALGCRKRRERAEKCQWPADRRRSRLIDLHSAGSKRFGHGDVGQPIASEVADDDVESAVIARPEGLQTVSGILDERHRAVRSDVLLEDHQFANAAIPGNGDQFDLAVTVEIAERRPHARPEIGLEGKRLGVDDRPPRGGIHQRHQRRARPAGIVGDGNRPGDKPVGVGSRVVRGVRFTACRTDGGRAHQVSCGRSTHVGDDREHRLAVGRECDLGIEIAGAHGRARGTARIGNLPRALRDGTRQRRRQLRIYGGGVALVLYGERIDDLRCGRIERAVDVGDDVVVE